jgi:hypothetical protein
MIFEDERAAAEDQLAFVLHLGDFVYEVVQYPEDVPSGHRYDRRLRDAVRYPQGEKIPVGAFRVPASLADYRALYCAYLQDPDLQDARARFPFVPMWDNHEFSWQGWQSFQAFAGETRPAQTRKVEANQAGSSTSRRGCATRDRRRSRVSRRLPCATRRSNASTSTGSARSPTTSPPSAASPPTARCAGGSSSTSSSPTSTRTAPSTPAAAARHRSSPAKISRPRAGRGAGDPRRRPRLRRRQAAGDDPLRRGAGGELSQG